MSEALVLNRNFAAIQIADWRKSMSLIYQGIAEAVDDDLRTYNFADWCELSKTMESSPSGFVHTATLKIAVPEIIRLVEYDRLPERDVKFTRRNLFEHYNYKCCYCGQKKNTKDLNLDHVIPRARGGLTTWNNIVVACIPCNTRKADHSPEEVGMKLLVKPSKPKWKGSHSIVQFNLPVKIKQSWQKLIDKVYWDGELKQG